MMVDVDAWETKSNQVPAGSNHSQKQGLDLFQCSNDHRSWGHFSD